MQRGREEEIKGGREGMKGTEEERVRGESWVNIGGGGEGGSKTEELDENELRKKRTGKKDGRKKGREGKWVET